MKNIFVNKEDSIKVNFVVGTDKNGKTVSALKESDFDKSLEVKDLESHYVIFRVPTYADNVEVFSKTLTVEGDNATVDPALLRYERFCILVKDWSFKDEEDKAIRASRENIDSLSTNIANTIMDGLDNALNENF